MRLLAGCGHCPLTFLARMEEHVDGDTWTKRPKVELPFLCWLFPPSLPNFLPFIVGWEIELVPTNKSSSASMFVVISRAYRDVMVIFELQYTHIHTYMHAYR